MGTEPAPDAALLWAALRAGALLAALCLAAWAWLRWRGRWRERHAELRVLERTWLARGTSAVLLEADGRRFLVGVGADGARLIAELERSAPAENFADAMDAALHRRAGGAR